MTRDVVCIAAIWIFSIAVCSAQDKVRVFITDSQSWETKGAGGFSNASGGGTVNGGARPQNAEIAKTFSERCPQLTVTINRDKADCVVTLDHEGGKNLVQRDNKWVVYNKEGDMIGSGSTRSLGNSVKDACALIAKGNERLESK